MADAVTTQVLTESPGNYVGKFTNISDGTGEAAVTKIDVSALTPSASKVSIRRCVAMTQGMAVRVYWDATTDVLAFQIPENQVMDVTFDPPIVNNAGDGITGDVQFTTVGHTSGDAYTIILYCGKS
ncbi:MAG: hypothetical protein EHM49_00950 [Deltaproteobacteria bacterium]|nr:MAG: hypothetical protein EHM49_00950 [Deltaproteobacteria bacterium]